MSTIADQRTLDDLVTRLRRLTPDTERRWGMMTAGEMLCHLGDAHEAVLKRRIPPGPTPPEVSRPVIKWVALHAPLPWPRGFRTRPGVNPKLDGTKPGDFERDRARAVESLQELARVDPTTLSPRHFFFGPMSARDWYTWAYRHVAHHLRQFRL